MARHRMYVFERAYSDYGARLRDFSRALWGRLGDVWEWFWNGPFAAGLSVVLQFLIVISGSGAAIWYLTYEKGEGRGFSFSTAFVLVWIAVFVYVLSWSWKAPVHVLARALTGGAAVFSVAVLFALAIVAAFVVFSAYLLALVAITALSFLVFLPMRGLHWTWLLYRKITYRCPYDRCSENGLPIHICSCGIQYDDLRPSFYGIFHHVCRHDDGDVKLPTLDILGRKKLDRLCRKCERPLVHSSFGELPIRPILVAGGVATGKSVFLRQAVRDLRGALDGFNGARVEVDSREQEESLSRDLRILDDGSVLDKTVADATVEAFGVAVRLKKPAMKELLYFYDPPGEDFASMSGIGAKQSVEHLRGIILIVDPFATPALRGRTRQGLVASKAQLNEVVGHLIGAVDATRRSRGKHDVPVAIVLSKVDALGKVASQLGIDGNGSDRSAICRSALNKLGEGNAIRSLEQRFSQVRYYACSALGRIPDSDRSAFVPRDVLEPLLWASGLRDVPRRSKNQEANR